MKITCPGIEVEWQLSTPNHEGWMSAAVFVKVPSFEGSFRCSVEQAEWDAFVSGLHGLESSIGRDAQYSWSNMEANLELTFSLAPSGALYGSYRFSPDNFSLGPTLTGSFEADQTYLRAWVNSAVEEFEDAR